MKEDILEQLIEDWLVSQTGWFVKHNIKYRPKKGHKEYNTNRDSVHSDIDILAFSNNEKGKSRVIAVTCKSWQGGFNPQEWLQSLEKEPEYNERTDKFKPREKWKYFRELSSTKWTEAFVEKIENETGQRDFNYYIAVTKLNGKNQGKELFEKSIIFKKRFKKFNSNVDIRIISLEEIINDYCRRMELKDTDFLEATNVGRLLQLVHAAELKIQK